MADYPELRFDAKEPFTAPRLNAAMDVIDRRMRAQEGLLAERQAAIDELRAYGLRRLDEAFRPLYAEIEGLAQLGAMFSTTSATLATVGTGTRAFTVAGDDRARFAPAAYLLVRSVADPSARLFGELLSYDRTDGLLSIAVSEHTGAAGAVHDDWTISPSAAPDRLTSAAELGAYTAAQTEEAIADRVGAPSPFGRDLIAAATSAAGRTALGLGSASTLSAPALRDRGSHTGTQALGTIAGLLAALAGKVERIEARADLSGHTPSGLYYTAGASRAQGWPVDSGSFCFALVLTHPDPGNNNSIQVAAPYGDPDDLYVRNVSLASGAPNAATATAVPWRRLLGDGDAAALRDRATHTGTQPIATVAGLTEALGAPAIIARLRSADYLEANVVAEGAIGDGATPGQNVHWQAAIDALAADGGGTLIGPGGDYLFNDGIVQRPGVHLVLDPRCRIVANVMGMPPLIDLLEGSIGELTIKGLLEGGILDCNDKCPSGARLRFFARYVMLATEIRGNTGKAIELGSLAAPHQSYEFIGQNLNLERHYAAPYPAGSSGIFFTNCGDSHVVDTLIRGHERFIDGTYWDSKISRVHGWNTSLNGAVIDGFRNYGGQTIYGQCQCDGPITGAAYSFQGLDHQLIGSSTNQVDPSYGGTDNVASCVHVAEGMRASLIGNTFKGLGNARWLHEVAGDTRRVTAFGNKSSNVTNVLGDQGPGMAKAWVNFRGSDGYIFGEQNVLSITREQAGGYVVNFRRPIGGAFSVHPTAMADPALHRAIVAYEAAGGRSETTIRIWTTDLVTGGLADAQRVSVVVYANGV